MPSPTPESDHAVFLRLCAEHHGALQAFVRSLLASREEATEVMQEMLLVLWQTFDQVEEFRPWAFGVARNMVLRHLRAQKRDRHVFSEDLVHQLADDATALVERHAGHREALEECLNKLPATQRQLVLTAYTKGTRIDDLARAAARRRWRSTRCCTASGRLCSSVFNARWPGRNPHEHGPD